MTKKSASKSRKSDRRVLKKIGKAWVRDPFTGRMLFKPTCKRLTKNAIPKEAKEVVPAVGDAVDSNSNS